MEWHWVNFLSKVAGCEGWDDRDKYFTCISKARFVQDRSKLLFHVSTEASLVLLFANCRERWEHGFKWEDANPGKTLPKRKKANKHMPMFISKHTSQDGGQQKLGGWDDAGIKLFNELHQEIKEARKKVEYEEFEEDFLAHLRARKGIVATNA